MAQGDEQDTWRRFGRLLTDIREQAGMSLQEAASNSAMSSSEISAWEASSTLPVPIQLSRLFEVYGPSRRDEQNAFALLSEASSSLDGALRLERAKRHFESGITSAESGLQYNYFALPSSAQQEPGVFISYRRTDEAGFSGRLYDRLESKFGSDRVFMDVDSIELGTDFIEELEASLDRCSVLIVVIGPRWLTAANEHGRRLDDPDDFVRLEIKRSLDRGIHVIPVLVDGAEMPSAAQLPEDIRRLARRNGRAMSNARFGSDCLEIISSLERLFAKVQRRPSSASLQSPVSSQDRGNAGFYMNSLALALVQRWARAFKEDVLLHWPPDVEPVFDFALGLPRHQNRQVGICVIQPEEGQSWADWSLDRRLNEIADVARPCFAVTRATTPDFIIDQLTSSVVGSTILVAFRWEGQQDEYSLDRAIHQLASRFDIRQL